MRFLNCSWFTIEKSFLKSFRSKRRKLKIMAISRKTCKIYAIQRRLHYIFRGKRRNTKIFPLNLLKRLRKWRSRKRKEYSFH